MPAWLAVRANALSGCHPALRTGKPRMGQDEVERVMLHRGSKTCNPATISARQMAKLQSHEAPSPGRYARHVDIFPAQNDKKMVWWEYAPTWTPSPGGDWTKMAAQLSVNPCGAWGERKERGAGPGGWRGSMQGASRQGVQGMMTNRARANHVMSGVMAMCGVWGRGEMGTARVACNKALESAENGREAGHTIGAALLYSEK